MAWLLSLPGFKTGQNSDQLLIILLLPLPSDHDDGNHDDSDQNDHDDNDHDDSVFSIWL